MLHVSGVAVMRPDDPFLALSDEEQERIIDSWADPHAPPMSEHVALEIEAVFRRGGVPLKPGQPVPGCSCERCTGIPADHPDRWPAWRRADPEGPAQTVRERRERWERRVDAARALGIIEIAARLGCGDPVRRGRELLVRCPLHNDNDPSCTIEPTNQLYYCFVCALGGDAIDLYMRARRLDFADAVRGLAA